MHDYKDRPDNYDRKSEGKICARSKNDWFLWVSTGVALFFVVNAIIQVMDTW